MELKEIGLLYDYLQVEGGAEKVSLDMLKYYASSELIVSSISDKSFPGNTEGLAKVIALRSFSAAAPIRVLKALYSFKQSRKYINQYEKLIYSGFYAPLAIQQRTLGHNFYYCHTPPRYLYDLKDYYESKLGGLGCQLLRLFSSWYEPQYKQAIEQMDGVISNSKNVQARLKKYLDIDSVVIPPPVNIERFKFMGQGDYYISLARLEPIKRVDIIIKAFKLMPNKKLVIASGGSEYNRLKKLADSADNIIFTGWKKEEDLNTLIGNAIASIYIAKDEDFGLSPVESQAAGKPVIGVAEGGLLETINHGQTGYLINGNIEVENLIKAVGWMSPSKALKLKDNCLENAKQYNAKAFFIQMDKYINI